MRAEFDGEPISEMDLINVLPFHVRRSGHRHRVDVVSGRLVGQEPGRRAELIADPDLLRPAIEELLRYEGPVPSGMRYPRPTSTWARASSSRPASRSTPSGPRPTSIRPITSTR